MNLTELVAVVSDRTGITKGKAKEVVTTALDALMQEVKQGGRVTVVGFGAFYGSSRRARLGRNPQTGDALMIPASRVPRFRPGQEFKELLKKR